MITRKHNLANKNISSICNSLKLSSSVCAVIGGVILAANIDISCYGFIFLAFSSSQLLIASIKAKDYLMVVYATAIFLFVDCLGIYRWLLT